MFNVRSLMAKRRTGFTLVEILVVILIIGLLFVFLVPKIDSSTDKARETGIKTDMRSYQTAFESVAREQGGLGANAIYDKAENPKNEKVVIDLINGYLDPALKITYADGDAMEAAKDDPWNNNYLVEIAQTTSNNGYVSVRTKGKDMRDSYDASKITANLSNYTLDAAGKVSAPAAAANGCLDTDLENARIGSGTTATVDDYVLGTWYLDGQIFSATAGFTTNIESGILID